MKGTIEQVWENESRNGQQYLTVQIDGERYSVWDTEYFDQLQEGAEIEYEFRQSEQNDGPPMYHNDRDRQITRLSCLKSVEEIIAPAQFEPDTKRDLVIETARVFERYVREDDPGSLPAEQQGETGAGNSG